MVSQSLSRRRFIALSAGTLAATTLAKAYPLGLPLGMQLYSVRTMLPKDFAGTLKQVGALGYTEVEAAGFYDHTPDEVKAAMQAAGLSCVSAHYPLGALKPQTRRDHRLLQGPRPAIHCLQLSDASAAWSRPYRAHTGRLEVERRPVQPDRGKGQGSGHELRLPQPHRRVHRRSTAPCRGRCWRRTPIPRTSALRWTAAG